MRKLYAIFVPIIYTLFEPDRVFSHDSLLILTKFGIEFPYKAVESNGQITYPEIEQNEERHSYLCHPQSREVQKIIASSSEFFPDDKYCLTDHTNIISSQEFPSCPSEIQPLLTDRLYKNPDTWPECGNSVHHAFYYFGFNYCKISNNPLFFIPVKSQVLSIYNICLNVSTWRPFWTKHQVRTGFMLQDPGLPSQNLENEPNLSTEAFTSQHLARYEDIFEQQAIEYENQEPDTPHKMIPQQLVPHEDIALRLWKKTTTHLVNTAPLWEKLVPVMKSINNGIRKAAIRVNLESYDEQTDTYDDLDIYTKTYSHLSLLRRILNMLNFFYKEPFGWNIWCKFVHYASKNQGILIFVHNLPDNPPEKLNSQTDSLRESLLKKTETDDDSNKPAEKLNSQTDSLQESLLKKTETDDDSNKPAESSKGKETDNSKTKQLLKEKECQTTVPCDFIKWSNQSEQGDLDISSDLFKYAYCCEVDAKKIQDLFGLKLENQITLLDIDDMVTNKPTD